MQRISAVIITKNEEKNIERCLQSLKDVVDEIVVFDSQSSDNTVAICKRYDVKVVSCQWNGYAETKNQANAAASNEYILWVDADEALSDELQNSIRLVKQDLNGAYTINRLNNYCGHWIRHGGFYPDKKVRLFNRNEAHWIGKFVHEKLQRSNEVLVKHLDGDLLHFSYSSISDHWKRMKKYSSLGALQIKESGVRFKLLRMLISPLVRFTRDFIFRAGFLDGVHGLFLITITSVEVFEKYRKSLFENTD